MAFSLFERWSPEYALTNAFEDIKKSGLDGLKKHLTSNALKNVQTVESLSGRPELSMFTSAFMGGNAAVFLLDKLQECEWTIKDVMKGSEASKAVVGFDYQDKMTGTIELKMIKEDSVWKIDGLAMPKFEKFPMPQAKTDQPAESEE